MTTREFAERVQAVLKEVMTFDVQDGANFELQLNDDDEALVCSGKSKDEHFILHIIKIKGVTQDDQKNQKGNSTKKQ